MSESNVKKARTRDQIDRELTFIQSAADIVQVAATHPHDSPHDESISDMMMRVHDSAERVMGLVFPESPKAQEGKE